MSESEPTRPLPPARVLPPPSLRPGYYTQTGRFGYRQGRDNQAPSNAGLPTLPRPQEPPPAHQQSPPYAGPGQQPYRGPAQQPPYAGPGQQPPAYPQSPSTEQPPAQYSPPPAGPPAPASYQPQGQHYNAPGRYNPGQYTPGQYTPHPYQQYTPYAPRPAPYGYAQPQWGYGGWAPPPPPRRRSGGRLALGMVGVSAVVFFALIVLSAVTGISPGSRSDVAVDHSPARASNPNTEPVDASDATAVLERNTLYQQGGLANGACPAQDLGTASTEDQTRFYEALITCLNDEWQPVVESAGYDYADPGLVVFDTAITTPCGSFSPENGRTLAFYCPSDQVLYADVPQMRKFFGTNDVAYAIVIGHEFGHHVQEEIGLLTAFDDAVYDDFDNRLELSRRVELQASCMGGLFLGAIAANYPIDETRLRQLDRVSGSFGDEPGADDDNRDHGSGVSNREWIMKGYTDNDLQSCNTFSASSDEVD